jgi:hypothetical protein
MAAEKALAPTGSRIVLAGWIGIGAVAWAVHRPVDWMRRRLRLPALIPGVVIVATNSVDVAAQVRDTLRSITDSRGLLRPRHVKELGQSATFGTGKAYARRPHARLTDPSQPSSRGPYVWDVAVRHGLEQAFLRLIRYRVARQLAQTGGYERLDWRMALFLVEHVVAANQAREVIPASPMQPYGPIAFTDQHQQYKAWLCNGPEPAHPVEVAILDGAVNLEHLPPPLADRVENHENGTAGFLGHGAAMAAVVADLAPSAHVTVYPIYALTEAIATETVVAGWLGDLRELPRPPDVVLMAFEFNTPGRPVRSLFRQKAIEAVLPVQLQTSAVAAAGNGATGVELAAPASYRGMMAVGAVSASRTRAPYSCYRLPPEARGPRTFAVAPGGVDPDDDDTDQALTINGQGFWGTSVAAAYAAGLIARVLGQVDESQRVSYEAVFKLLADNADTTLVDQAEISHGIGLLRQARTV